MRRRTHPPEGLQAAGLGEGNGGATSVETGAETLTLPLLPIKDSVVFPDSMAPLAVGQERSVRLIDDVVSGDGKLVLIASRNVETEEPGWDDIYEIGVEAVVQRMLKIPDGSLRLLVQGLRRVRSPTSPTSCRSRSPTSTIRACSATWSRRI